MKKLLILMACMLFCGIATAQEVELEATADVVIQTDRSYEFDALWMEDLEMNLSSTVATVGVDVAIGDLLTLSPRVGIWDSEMEIEDKVTLENSAGLALGLGAEYLLASVAVDEANAVDISLVSDYLFADSEVDEVKFNNIAFELPLKNDINRHDLFAGVKGAYSGLPVNGTVSLALGYSHSEIDLGASIGMADIDLDMESKGFSIRPALAIEPIDGLNIEIGGRFIDQIAGQVKCAYKF